MRLKKNLVSVGFVGFAIFVLSSFNSVFAQCPPGYSYCNTFSGWCCLDENYCADPTPPYCQPFNGTSSSSSSSSTTTIASTSIPSTSSSSSSTVTSTVPSTSSSSSSSTFIIDENCQYGDLRCPYGSSPNISIECCDSRFYECCYGGCCSLWSCPFTQIYGVDSTEAELLRKYRDGILSKTSTGREVIRLYYEWSPVIASVIEEDQEFKVELKELIDEMLPMIEELVE